MPLCAAQQLLEAGYMERSESMGMNAGSGSDQTNFSGSGTGGSETSFQNSGLSSTSATSDTSSTDSGGVSGRVRNIAASAKDKASNIPAIIADGLERGANALRQTRTTSGDSTGGSAVALVNDSSIAAVTDTLATGMQSSADWLRDADLDKIKTDVEKQVKEHPGRTLLIALGAGYLLGKVFRR